MSEVGPSEVRMVDQDGRAVLIPRENVSAASQDGFRLETVEEKRHRFLQEKHGTTAGEFKSAALGTLRGATLGLSDAALAASGQRELVSNLKEANPIASTGGEIAGAVGSALIPGGAPAAAAKAGAGAKAGLAARALSSPARALANVSDDAGRLITKGMQEGTLAQAALKRGVQYGTAGAIEGAGVGAGQLVSEAALGDTEITAQKALAHIGMSALLGGIGGGAVGSVGGLGVAAGKKLIKAADAKMPSARELLEHQKNLRATRSTFATQSNIRKVDIDEVGEEIMKPRPELDGGSIMGKAGGPVKMAERAEVARRVAGKEVGAARKRLDKMADHFAEQGTDLRIDPSRISQRIRSELGDGLADTVGAKAERQYIEDLAKQYDDLAAKSERLSFDAAERNKSFLQKKIEKEFGKTKSTPLNDIKKKAAGIIRDESEQAAKTLAEAVGDTSVLDEFREAKRKYRVASDIVDLTRQGKDRAEGNRTFSLTDYVLGSGIGAVSGVGSAVAFGSANKVLRERGSALAATALDRMMQLGAMHKAAQAVDGNISKSIDAFVKRQGRLTAPAGAGVTGAEGSAALLPLDRVALDDRPSVKTEAKRFAKMAADQENIASEVAHRLNGLAAVAPHIAHAMTARAIQASTFLAEKAPRPSEEVNIFGRDPYVNWTPTDTELDQFSRYLRAVENPMNALAELQSGDLSSEAVEVLESIYPDLKASIADTIREKVGQLNEELPYQDQVQLSLWFGVPIDATLEPDFIRLLQSNFADEGPQSGRGPQGIRLSGLDKLETSESKKSHAQRLAEI